MDEDKSLKYKYILVFGVFILFIISLNFIIINLGDSIKTVNYGSSIENYIHINNLSLPIPQAKFNYEFILNEQKAYEKYFNLPLKDFHKFIESHYVYDVNSYDCKYWSYVWTLYYQMNKEKYNWSFEYLDTENHVFTMISNSSGYCIADENNLNCFGNMGY